MSLMEAHYRSAAEEENGRHLRYRGIPMLCEEGLHELLGGVAQAELPPGARVLDVGCGQGALSLRLADLGFQVDACDQFDLCKCKEAVRFVHASAEAAELAGPYDAIFLVEVLEHVEAPFALLRKYAARLKPGGRLIVTTPNVDSDLSRAWFLLKGRHWYFDDACVKQDGHISPLHAFQLRWICGELGLRILREESVLENRTAAPGAFWAVIQLLRAWQRARRQPRNDGKIALWVLQR